MEEENGENFNYYKQYLKLINNCDVNDQLLSQTPLGQRLDQIPLEQINPSDLIQLNQALNLEQLIRTKHGLARDYRGLAELMDFSSSEIETRFKRSYNPTKSLIDSFIDKNLILINSQQHEQSVLVDNQSLLFTVNDLLKMIERLERFDIIDDFLPTLIRIASGSNGQLTGATKAILLRNNYDDKKLSDNLDRRLTIDDTGGFRSVYDAFICFAPQDTHYAEDLIRLLEEHNKSVATADDLLPGHFEHDALVQLIDMRCRKVIVILTPNFLRSKECEFQSKFASEVAIRANVGPKIIPVLYEPCDDLSLPYMIRVISKIDMTSRQARHWQLRKLISSLEYENGPEGTRFSPGGRLSSSRIVKPPGGDSPQPIVDLASSSMNSNCNLSGLITNSMHGDYHRASHRSPLPSLKLTPPPPPSSSGNASINWFKNVKRKLMGSQQQQQQHHHHNHPQQPLAGDRNSPSPSTSSQALLLTSGSSEFLPNGTSG